MSENFKCGYVSIIGEPNVGKSTLLNAILNTKLSITTPKPQTTRKKIVGIYSDDEAQIIFLDTPGIIKPKYLLQDKMVSAINESLNEAEIILSLCDVNEKSIENFEERVVSVIKEYSNKYHFLVINKIDLIHKEELLGIIDKLKEKFKFNEIIPVSAIKAFNISDLINTIKKYLPISPALYPTDIISNDPVRFFVAEIIREKIFYEYSEEIPYSTEVKVVEFKERGKNKDFISAEIFVERENQRKILIGNNGSAIKRLGEKARKDIEAFLERPVYLELRVKVKENWRNDGRILKQFGYEN